MRLTVTNHPHESEIVYPYTGPFPLILMIGPKDTLWAEDEDGNVWFKKHDRWFRTMRFSTNKDGPNGP